MRERVNEHEHHTDPGTVHGIHVTSTAGVDIWWAATPFFDFRPGGDGIAGSLGLGMGEPRCGASRCRLRRLGAWPWAAVGNVEIESGGAGKVRGRGQCRVRAERACANGGGADAGDEYRGLSESWSVTLLGSHLDGGAAAVTDRA